MEATTVELLNEFEALQASIAKDQERLEGLRKQLKKALAPIVGTLGGSDGKTAAKGDKGAPRIGTKYLARLISEGVADDAELRAQVKKDKEGSQTNLDEQLKKVAVLKNGAWQLTADGKKLLK